MSKIGILSMHRIVNYGSFLQAYGLKMLLEQLGHEVQFVDYHIGKPLICESSNQKQDFLRKLNKALETFRYNVPFSHCIRYVFYKKQFSSKYHSVLGITSEMNYTPTVDALVIGSDEVFNCIQSNPNVGYSLELFGKNNNAKKIFTYAASFGNTTVEKLEQFGKKEEIASLLKRFNAISVRDKNSGNIVSSLTGIQPKYHLDPVLAYDYIGECSLIPKIQSNDKYIILYAYSGRISEKESDRISAYAKTNGLKVYAIGGVQKCADTFIDCSPFEVLSYFLNAESVITDTFHGTIFSVITKRKFVTIVRKSVGNAYGNEEKLTDLLNRLGMMDRIVENINEMELILNKEINYYNVEKTIEKERKLSLEYLKKEID